MLCNVRFIHIFQSIHAIIQELIQLYLTYHPCFWGDIFIDALKLASSK